MAAVFIDSYFNSASSLRFLDPVTVINTPESSSASVLRLAVISEIATSVSSSCTGCFWVCALPPVGSGNGEVVNLVSVDCKYILTHAFLLTTYASVPSSRISWLDLGTFNS